MRPKGMRGGAKTSLLLPAIFLFTLCGNPTPPAAHITLAGLKAQPPWSAEELSKDIAFRTISSNKEASFHYLRVKGAEKPHIHKDHHTFVVIVSGSGFIHYVDKAFPYRSGDAIEIPRGKAHWAENKSPSGSIVYVFFTPPFDGKDRIPVEMPPGPE